jgi:hypothetical protein
MNRNDAEPTSFAASDLRGGPLGAGAPPPSSGRPAAAPTKGPTSSDKVDALLSLFPGPLTLWPDRQKALGAIGLGLIFIAMVLAGLVPHATEWKMLYLAVFGGCALYFAARLLPGAFGLTLDKDGFERVALFLKFRKSWRRTDTMTFWRLARRRIAAYGPRMQSVGHDDIAHPANNASRPLIGCLGALANSYNLSAKELVALMSQWRARALAQDDS